MAEDSLRFGPGTARSNGFAVVGAMAAVFAARVRGVAVCAGTPSHPNASNAAMMARDSYDDDRMRLFITCLRTEAAIIGRSTFHDGRHAHATGRADGNQ